MNSEILSGNLFLNHLTQDEIKDFQNEKKIFSYAKGKIIASEGTFASGVYFLIKGLGKISKIGINGKEQILRFVKAGEAIGYCSVLMQRSLSASIYAIENCETLFFPQALFLKIIENNSKFSLELLKQALGKLDDADHAISTLGQKRIGERLAESLLVMEKKLGTDTKGYLRATLTREELSALIGSATESTIRLLSVLKKEGLVELKGKKIKILKHEELRKMSLS
ncbi:Crp/Fnr family transcriptional regulator [Bacteroidetes bacterium endosymbiont of Geopemphigus sp.]|uniref:Crp/Fnr family transcriptional regulator n=1 Tax=Bacteroidetes bacterium endosymbiont of Geopemphigus sp. TaxID=2047937 RepID=UPI0018A7EA66|nr:Crp/Fnr family transcriptional regulator [Bacteroidetes bacterium endosymbiont of Geopemphigus sp.]